MVEVMIECWTNSEGGTDHIWSLWRDGSRLQLGNRHDTPEAAEAEALAFCRRALDTAPDRVTRL